MPVPRLAALSGQIGGLHTALPHDTLAQTERELIVRITLIMFIFISLIPLQLQAGEIFICDDGRMLAVDSTNRSRLADDPCVKTWFAKSKAASEQHNSTEARRRRFLREPSLPFHGGCGYGCRSCCSARIFVYRYDGCNF